MLKIKGDKEIYDGYQSNVMISWTTLQCLGVQLFYVFFFCFEGRIFWPVPFQGLGDFLLYIVEQSMLMCTFDPWAAYPGWGEGSRPQQRCFLRKKICACRYQGENLCSSIITHLYDTYIHTYIYIYTHIYLYTCLWFQPPDMIDVSIDINCIIIPGRDKNRRTVVLEGKRAKTSSRDGGEPRRPHRMSFGWRPWIRLENSNCFHPHIEKELIGTAQLEK